MGKHLILFLLVGMAKALTSPHVHTLLLCRHGDSVWNGGQEGCPERFTGWTDVALSERGVLEAHDAANQLSTYFQDVDVCFTSNLKRAQNTAEICLQPLQQQRKVPELIRDARLNERHYGALQGYIKQDVEDGKYGYPPHLVEQWRRSWYARPPPMAKDDPRFLQEVYEQGQCPNGESLHMVAQNRIRPFLDDTLIPLLEKANRPTTGLVVAHANSLRALIGIICNVEENPRALEVLEGLKIPTGVPLVLHFSQTRSPNEGDEKQYHAVRLPEPDECLIQEVNGWIHRPQQAPPNLGHASLPVWPLDVCIPTSILNVGDSATTIGAPASGHISSPHNQHAV